MDRIYELFRDPAWWFTAVFIGIMASLLAGYLHGGISSVTAYASGTVRKRRTVRLTRQRQHIDLFLSNPNLLLLEYVASAIILILFFGVFCMFVSVPLLIYLTERVDELKKFNVTFGITDRDFLRKINIVFMILIGCFDMYIGYNWALNSRVLAKARKEYISKCKRGQADNQ